MDKRYVLRNPHVVDPHHYFLSSCTLFSLVFTDNEFEDKDAQYLADIIEVRQVTCICLVFSL